MDPVTASRGEGALPPEPLRRIVLWGSYDLGKPRIRILRDGLLANGVAVTEIHADIWAGQEDKSRLSAGRVLMAGLRLALAYPGLIWRYLRTADHDLVLVPYLGQFDVLVLWPFAWLRRKPVVWDMFISLYDTVVNDRRLRPSRSPVAWVLWLVEWLGTRAAARVVIDTTAHARHIARLFGLAPDRIAAVPVGAEPGTFRRQPMPPREGRPIRILFYGQMIPLHGIGTILAAALSDRGRARDWTLIGSGQESHLVAAALGQVAAKHVTWRDWVPYAGLTDEIARADICLGIFGASDKAASVVPNKVYQCLVSGRPLVTRDSPALREAFGAGHPGLELVPPADPVALLDAIDRLEAAGFPVLPADRLTQAGPAEVARAFQVVVAPLLKEWRP